MSPPLVSLIKAWLTLRIIWHNFIFNTQGSHYLVFCYLSFLLYIWNCLLFSSFTISKFVDFKNIIYNLSLPCLWVADNIKDVENMTSNAELDSDGAENRQIWSSTVSNVSYNVHWRICRRKKFFNLFVKGGERIQTYEFIVYYNLKI